MFQRVGYLWRRFPKIVARLGRRIEGIKECGILVAVGTIAFRRASAVHVSRALREHLYHMHVVAVAERAVHACIVLIIILMAGRTLSVLSDVVLHEPLGFIRFCNVMHRPVADDAGNCGISIMVIRSRGIVGKYAVQSGLLCYIGPVMAVAA